MRIRRKLTIIFLLIASVPLIAFSVTSIITGRQVLKKEIGLSLELIAREKAASVASVLNRRVEEAEILARKDVVVDAIIKANSAYSGKTDHQVNSEIGAIDLAWIKSKGDVPLAKQLISNNASAFLREYRDRDPLEYAEIFLTDRFGATVAMTSTLTDYYQADEGWWKEGFADGKGEIYLDDRGYDLSANAVVIGVIVPVQANGGIVGLLKINYKMAHIPAIITHPYDFKDVKVFMYRANGTAVIDPTDGLHEISTKTQKRIMAKMEKSGWSEDGHDAEPTIMGHAHIRSDKHIFSRFQADKSQKGVTGENWGQSNWFVFVERNRTAAYEPITSLMTIFILGGIVLILIIVLLAHITATKITSPLIMLRNGLANITAGQLALNVSTDRKDEIGDVIRDTSRMVNRLKETLASRDELNQEISEREKVETQLRQNKKELENNIIQLDASRDVMQKQASDMIELAENEAALNVRLHQEITTKNRFFSIISHDLRGPFTSLLGMTSVLSDMADKFTKEQILDYAHNTHKAGNQVYDLLQNLLEWSRLQMEGGTIKLETFSMQDLAQETIDVLKPIAQDKGVTVKAGNSSTRVHADLNMVKTIIRNLMENAIKFTPQGGTITVEYLDNEGMLQVIIKDTGVGMSEEKIKYIFSLDHKTTTLGTNGEVGTGMGLPLCKELVELNGGKIWAKSAVDEGTQFHFTLPIEAK